MDLRINFNMLHGEQTVPILKRYRRSCFLEQTDPRAHGFLGASGCAVYLWTANIALTLAEETHLRSFYQQKVGPKCRARGPELQHTDCGDSSFWSGLSEYCRHCFIYYALFNGPNVTA